MKTKYLIITLSFICTLYIYFNVCMYIVNKRIINDTNNAIVDYLDTLYVTDYKYNLVQAINNKNNSLNLYIKVRSNYKDIYYNFTFSKYNYTLIEVNQDVPKYVKIPLI